MDLNKLLKTQWDRAAAIGCTALGALLLLLGWIGVSGTPYLAEQAPYILSGGIGGLFLLGLGATLWVSADLRDEWRKLDRIETAIGDGTLRWAEEEPAASVTPRRALAEAPLLPPPTEILLEPAEPALPLAVVDGSRPAKAARTASKPAPKTKAATPTARTRRPAAPRARVSTSTHDA